MAEAFTYYTGYASPLGELLLLSDGSALTGLYFAGQKNAPDLADAKRRDGLPAFVLTSAWLDLYFSGEEPLFLPPLSPAGTPFQLAVWTLLTEIPYGQTVSYKDLADAVGSSPRAVGQAVGKNPLSLVVPCHRVVGANGGIAGYAGGVDRKRALLALERKKAE